MKQVSIELSSMGFAVDKPEFKLVTRTLVKLHKHMRLLIPHL